jgi:hypothetical protein
MATDQAKHRKWADAQVAALLELGVDLADAQRSVKWTLDTMPEGADPNTWIPTVEQLYHDPSTPEAIQDAHSFVRDGKIEYLSDSRHELAGQTIEMLEEAA